MNKKQIAITLGIMCLILTMTIVIQIKAANNANKLVSPSFSNNDLRNQVLKWKERYDSTYATLQSAEKKLESVRQTASENTDGSAEKEEQLKKNNILLGLTDVTGEGIIVTIKDNNNVSTDSTIIDPSYYLVHYGYLLKIVNELKNAGAEAISINGVRILSMTDIVDIDSYILIKPRQRLISPYVVKAIGNQTYLTSTLCMKNSGFIDSYKNSGKTVTLEKQRNIKIPKYSENIDIKYMKEVAGE